MIPQYVRTCTGPTVETFKSGSCILCMLSGRWYESVSRIVSTRLKFSSPYYAYPILVIDTEKVCRRPASSASPRCRPTGALIIGAREIFMQSSPFCKSRPINMLLPLLALVGFAAGCGEQHPYARDIHHHENVDKREYPQFPLTPPSRPLEWGDLNVIHTTDTHGWLLGHQKTSWPEPNYR